MSSTVLSASRPSDRTVTCEILHSTAYKLYSFLQSEHCLFIELFLTLNASLGQSKRLFCVLYFVCLKVLIAGVVRGSSGVVVEVQVVEMARADGG